MQESPRSAILAATPVKQEPSFTVPSSPSFRRIGNEPAWRPSRQHTTAALPPAIRPWLLDDGSLTVRLTGLGKGQFRVQRLYQGWQVPLRSESSLLSAPPRQLALIREVTLSLGGRPVVFARSVFPVTSLTGELTHLRRLEGKSLGAILFRHPGMRRSPFELARVRGDSDYLPAELHQQAPAWCRRSRFNLEGGSVMVSEVFLDDFVPWRALLPVHRTQRGKVSAAIMRTKQ